MLCKIATKGYTMRYTANNTNIYSAKLEEKLEFQRRPQCQSKPLEYYTYTERGDRQHAYVLKGLEMEDLEQEQLLTKTL